MVMQIGVVRMDVKGARETLLRPRPIPPFQRRMSQMGIRFADIKGSQFRIERVLPYGLRPLKRGNRVRVLPLIEQAYAPVIIFIARRSAHFLQQGHGNLQEVVSSQ